MDTEYICTGCGMLYTIEDLEDNYDGTCFYCDCPLVPLNKGSFFNLHVVDDESMEVNKMVYELQNYHMSTLWHGIEKLKDPKVRLKYRRYFFNALKMLGKPFELSDQFIERRNNVI